MSDQVMKLFEALSDVDEELLERCNHDKNRKITYVLLWKYKRAMTACLCLFIVGALSWGGYQLMGGRKSSSGSGSDSAAPAQIQDMAVPMESAAGESEGDFAAGGENTSQYTALEEAETEGIEDAERQVETENSDRDFGIINQTGNGKGSGAGESMSGSSNGNSTADNLDSPIADRSNAEKQVQKEESAVLDSRSEIPWDTACAAEPFGSYLPTVIPAGYEPLSARQSAISDEWNNMTFKWENGEQILCLDMTVREAKDNDEIKAEIEKSDGLHQYPAEDFKKELIPEPVDGEIMFTLYYSDGMRIDFAGNITVDEMWELVESIHR